jgi:hypothetical protein
MEIFFRPSTPVGAPPFQPMETECFKRSFDIFFQSQESMANFVVPTCRVESGALNDPGSCVLSKDRLRI